MLVDEQKIQDYLDRIAESGTLGQGARRRDLLKYLLLAELNGTGEKIKAYAIGLDVFGKSEDFDPVADSSIRVEVGRLRNAIALFEASEFADTDIKVAIPVGSYRPDITQRACVADGERLPAVPGHQRWLPHGVRRFRPLYLALGLLVFGAVWFAWVRPPPRQIGPPITVTVADFTGAAFGRDLPVFVKDSFTNNPLITITDSIPVDKSAVHFLIKGHVTDYPSFRLATVELSNTDTDQIVWSHAFQVYGNENLQAQVDEKLNGELETRLLGAVKRYLEGKRMRDLSPEELFILGTWVSGPAQSSLTWETERVALMKRALELNPDFGPAHSVLADKYGFLANMHPAWDTPENLRLSRFHADRAIELSPLDANAMFNVAQSYWHAGRHADSQRLFSRVLELDSANSLARFFATVVPYWCNDVPDAVMDWAIGFDQGLSRDDPSRWIVLTWIATLHTNRGETDLAFAAALEASQIFQVGYTYVLLAMLQNEAGQSQEARQTIEWQSQSWPGATTSHYVQSSLRRLCAEQPTPAPFLRGFDALDATLGMSASR